MNTLIEVLRTFCLFGCLFFMLVYHLAAPWWRSEMGRNIMCWTGFAALLLSLASLRALFGPGYWGEDALRLIGFTGMAVAIYWRLIILIRSQLNIRDQSSEERL